MSLRDPNGSKQSLLLDSHALRARDDTGFGGVGRVKYISIQQLARFLLVVVAAIALTGCGAKTPTQTGTATPDDYFPGVDRSTVVSPSNRTLTSEQQNDQLVTNRETIKTNLKIGGTTQIKINRFGLTGLVRIISATSVSLESFSYDGKCPAFGIYLTRSNNTTSVLVPFNMANRVYSNETLKVNFPSSVTINDVDSVAVICENTKEPMVVERLS